MKILPDKDTMKRRTLLSLGALIVVVIIMLGFFVFPRTSVEINTWYSEGMLDTTTIDMVIRNTGTNRIKDMTVHLEYRNETSAVLANHSYTGIDLLSWQKHKVESLYVTGSESNSHFANYSIILSVHFNAGGKHYFYKKVHETEEPYLNLYFTDIVK